MPGISETGPGPEAARSQMLGLCRAALSPRCRLPRSLSPGSLTGLFDAPGMDRPPRRPRFRGVDSGEYSPMYPALAGELGAAAALLLSKDGVARSVTASLYSYVA